MNNIIDDTYAQRIRDNYLSDGTEVVFYTKQAGVSGQSFTDENTQSLIRSYFTEGSEWVQNSITDKTVSLDNGDIYG